MIHFRLNALFSKDYSESLSVIIAVMTADAGSGVDDDYLAYCDAVFGLYRRLLENLCHH